MLNFKTNNILFAFFLSIILVINIFIPVYISLYFILLLIYSLIIFYGCYNINSQFFCKVICNSKTDKKQISISFDDGPANNFTSGILQILNENNIKAAFFCIGNRINKNEHLLKQLHQEGHLLANHSYSHHFFFDFFSSSKMLADLKKADDKIEQIVGLRPKFFRPPYGVTNPNLKKAILKGNYIAVGWNVRTWDTIIKDKEKLLSNTLRRLKPGAIILFHDTSKSTFEILSRFIQETHKNGYEIVRLDTLLKHSAYA